MNRAQLKLGNILANDNDIIPTITDTTKYHLEMQTDDIQYLDYIIDMESNPQGIVKFKLKKAYGNGVIYASEYSRRPNENSHQHKFIVSPCLFIFEMKRASILL